MKLNTPIYSARTILIKQWYSTFNEFWGRELLVTFVRAINTIQSVLSVDLSRPWFDHEAILYYLSQKGWLNLNIKPRRRLDSFSPPWLQVESDEIVEGVMKNDVPVEYIVFPDEGHGFIKKENEIKANSQILTFLDKYLKKEVVAD